MIRLPRSPALITTSAVITLVRLAIDRSIDWSRPHSSLPVLALTIIPAAALTTGAGPRPWPAAVKARANGAGTTATNVDAAQMAAQAASDRRGPRSGIALQQGDRR